MKLKREHFIFFGKTIGICKGWLALAFFTVCFCVSAQNYSVTSGNTPDITIPDGIATATEAEGGNGSPGRFIVTRNTNSFGPVTVNYNVTGTANPRNSTFPNGDYVELSGQVTFADQDQDFAEIVVDVLPDNFVENNETVTVTLTSATIFTGAVDPTPATVTISDVTDVGLISLDLTEPPFIPNASEEGPTNGNFRIVLDKPNGTSAPVTVNYTLTGTAANGVDYTLDGAVAITFDPDESQVTRDLEIVPIDDTELEDLETVVLILNGTDNPLFSIGTPSTAEITITDNDCAAGDVAPVLNNNDTVFCDTVQVDLDTYYDGARPTGTALIWTTNNTDPLNQADWSDRTGLSPVNAPGSYYAFFWDEPNNCASPTAELILTQNTSPSAGTLVNASPTSACNNDTDEFGPNVVNLNTLITGQDGGGIWTSSPSVGPLPTNAPSVNFAGRTAGRYQFTYTTATAVAPCTEDSIVVIIDVTDCDPCVAGNTAPVLNTNVPRTFCDDITTTLDDYAPQAGPNGTVLRWATSSDNPTENFVPANRIADPLEGTYFGFYYDATNDCASPILTLSLVQNTTPEILSATGNSRCGTGTLQLTATANEDATIQWFSRATGGTVLQTGPSFTTPSIQQTTSYFVEGTANGCTSPRTEVIAEVFPQPSAGVPVNTSSCNSADFGVTVLDLDDTFSATADVGAWSFISGPTPITLGAENIVDFQGSANGTYVFSYTTSNAQAPCENETAEVSISVSSCDTDDDNDGLLGGLESQLDTDPNNPDTDGDGINDGVEVGDDTANPLDGDGDGIIDALDSNILDTDQDGVVDQLDPANENACIPDNSNGLCDTDQDGITDGQEEADGSNPLDACDPDITNGNCDPTPIDLEVLKEVDILNAIAGDAVVFTVTVNNLSARSVFGITIGDMLETGFIRNDNPIVASAGSYDAEAGVWTIPQLNATGSATLQIPVTVLEGGPYNNVAELLESFPLDDNPTNDRAEIILEIDLPEGIDLVLEKLGRIAEPNDSLSLSNGNRSLTAVNPLIGQEVIFTLRVTNESVQDTVSNIQVLDTIANVSQSGFEFLEAIADTGEYNPSTGIWLIPELARNGVAILEIRVAVPTMGTFQNTAVINRSSPADSEGNYDNNTSMVTVNVSERSEAEFGIIFNQFSPNNDGVNDNLKLNKRQTNEDGTLGDEVDVLYSIKIFNRYGSLVFEGSQLTDEVIWDGSRNGKEVPDGTYFYVLNLNVLEEIEGIDANSVKKGWIQIIR
ncbi:hypothetical protein LCGC14_0634150 [marine sediment metagenome]